MKLTVSKLRDLLDEYIDSGDGDMEVRLMEQENWPFECSIGAVATRSEILEYVDSDHAVHVPWAHVDGDEDADDNPDAEEVLFLIEGQQLGYGMRSAFNVEQTW